MNTAEARFGTVTGSRPTGSAGQRWMIESDAFGRSTLRNLASGLCMVVSDRNLARTGLVLGDCEAPDAAFHLGRDGTVRSMVSGQLLAVAGGTTVRQEPYRDNNRRQRWRVEPAVTGLVVRPDRITVDALPGERLTVGFELHNAGDVEAGDLRLTLRTPEGVDAEPTGPNRPDSLEPGRSERFTWQLSLPSAGVPIGTPITLDVGYRQGERSHSAAGKTWLDPRSLAVGKPARQSTTDWGGTADRAVDGDTSGEWGNGSVTHTQDGGESQPWWEVDLGSDMPIGEIRVWNRTDCCSERLSDYYVIAADQPIVGDTVEESSSTPGAWYAHETTTAGSPTVIDVPDGTTARHLRVHLNADNALSLAEVEVLPPTLP